MLRLFVSEREHQQYLPQRITENLCNIIKKYHPVWLNTHFNTSIEITEESKKAL